jgi:phosphohistidine swiveling domain-containing protein
MEAKLLVDLLDRQLPSSVGQKASNLRQLADKGFRIPRTYVIPWEAHQRYLANDISVIETLRSELASILLPDRKYAIRSSASIEDSLERSFAGQFKTVLNVNGVDPVLQAAWSIWATAISPGVQQYLAQLPDDHQRLDMAIIVQEMVHPIISGVAFSRNPMTGADEIVVEAVDGSGVQLVQEGLTPQRWTYKWGEWTAIAEESTIPLEVIQDVVHGTRKIARSLNQIIDLEWVYDGNQIFWVQVREITTLRDLNIYSNRISREMISGQIKPLIWSINIPLVITQWIRLLDEMVGTTHLQPEQLAKRFHHRVYFNMGILGQVFNRAGLPSEGLEMMMGVVPKEAGRPAMRMSRGMLKLFPRLMSFFYHKWYFSSKIQKNVPPLIQAIRSIDVSAVAQYNEIEILGAIRHLYDLIAKLAYYNITAPLLMMMYNGMISSQLKKQGVNSEQFDLMENMPEIEQYSPDRDLMELHQIYCNSDVNLQSAIQAGNISDLEESEAGVEFLHKVNGFLNRYGHLSDNGNDFSTVPWRENPAMILRMISSYIRLEAHGNRHLHLKDIRRRGLIFNLLYRRARQFRLFREQISSTYTYGYGLFRPYFLSLGERWVQKGILECASDIFYLDWQTVQILVEQPDQAPRDIRGQIEEIKSDMEKSRDLELPPVIYGDTPPPVIPTNSRRLHGTPTSQGYYSGPARVVRGIEDFPKVQSGDVLVIPFSEVGWTPLFAKAGAVVAESGGVLSHSSIVAREYHIPAVVSVPGAMKICDNQHVTVDGFKGEISLAEQE